MSDNVVKHGVVQQRWVVDSYYFLDKNPIVIEQDEHQSEFTISISNPAFGNQYFDSQYFISLNDCC